MRRTHRQLIIDMVQAYPKRTTKELYQLIQKEGVATGGGAQLRRRKDVPLESRIRVLCTRTPGIANVGDEYGAVWVWVGVDAEGRTIKVEKQGAEA